VTASDVPPPSATLVRAFYNDPPAKRFFSDDAVLLYHWLTHHPRS